MRVVVLTGQTPFASGDADGLADRLCEELDRHGHATQLIRIPFRAAPLERVVDQMLAVRLMHLRNVDRAVGLGFPAYLLAHDDKVVWLLQRFRDSSVSGGPQLDPGNCAVGRSAHAAVVAADRVFLGEAQRLYTRSAGDGRRLRDATGLHAEVLHPPLHDPGMFRCDGYGDYVLSLGAIGADDRRLLAVGAMGLARSAARLIVAGAPGDAGGLSSLRALAGELGASERVAFIPGPISDSERVRLLAGARAVLCLDEADGTDTLEAFQSRKAVVALVDPGHTPELVRDGVSGRVVSSAAELASAIDELFDDAALAERRGDAGFCRLHAAGISWQAVAEELTR